MFEKLIVYFSKHNLAYLIVITFFYIISFTLGFFHSLSHVYLKTNNNDLGMIFFGCQMHCRVSFVIVKVDDVVVVELALAERRHELDLAHDGGSLKQCPAPRTELCIWVQPNPEKHFKMIQLTD
jgi:hypothetical protein